jgi:hypothetical protein
MSRLRVIQWTTSKVGKMTQLGMATTVFCRFSMFSQ